MFDIWTQTTTGEVIVAEANKPFPIYGKHDFEFVNDSIDYHKCTVRVTIKSGVEYQTYSKDYHLEPKKKERSQLYTRLDLTRGVGDYTIYGGTDIFCSTYNHSHSKTSGSETPLKVYQPK